jgi:hypothetical protein
VSAPSGEERSRKRSIVEVDVPVRVGAPSIRIGEMVVLGGRAPVTGARSASERWPAVRRDRCEPDYFAISVMGCSDLCRGCEALLRLEIDPQVKGG